MGKMDKIAKQINIILNQEYDSILHVEDEYGKMNFLKYNPTDEMPFYKIVTLEASKYKNIGNEKDFRFNEYIVFIDSNEDEASIAWHCQNLHKISVYPQLFKTGISLYEVVVLGDYNEKESIQAAVLSLPKAVKDLTLAQFKIGFKTITLLQTIFITKSELEFIEACGSIRLLEKVYPNDGTAGNYVSKRYRYSFIELPSTIPSDEKITHFLDFVYNKYDELKEFNDSPNKTREYTIDVLKPIFDSFIELMGTPYILNFESKNINDKVALRFIYEADLVGDTLNQIMALTNEEFNNKFEIIHKKRI